MRAVGQLVTREQGCGVEGIFSTTTPRVVVATRLCCQSTLAGLTTRELKFKKINCKITYTFILTKRFRKWVGNQQKSSAESRSNVLDLHPSTHPTTHNNRTSMFLTRTLINVIDSTEYGRKDESHQMHGCIIAYQ